MSASAVVVPTQRKPVWLSAVMWILATWASLKHKLLRLQPAKSSLLLIDGVGKVCREVKVNATNWRALEAIYNHDFKKARSFSQALDNFWMDNVVNAVALRNRLRIAKDEIETAVRGFARPEVRVLSLAAGSARAVIETAAKLKREGITLTILLVDKDPTAATYARNLAEEFGVSDQIKTETMDILARLSLRHLGQEFKPDIVEMMGFLDYCDNRLAMVMIKNIRTMLSENGIFLTCNVMPNPEQYFLEHAIGWKMVYRTEGQLMDLVNSCGFKTSTTREPLDIHAIAAATVKAASEEDLVSVLGQIASD